MADPVLETEASAPARRRRSGQAMVELLFIFLIFMAIVFLAIQFTMIANARSMLNLATYAAAREYAVTYSGARANAAAYIYMSPLLPGSGSGDVKVVYISTPKDPGFGHTAKVKATAVYGLLPIPLLREYFGLKARLSKGLIDLKSTVDITME